MNMFWLLADFVLIIHVAFVLFAVLGGFLVLRWPRVAWGHLPCVVWGILVELTGWSCPLTPLEFWLRGPGYDHHAAGFLATYLHPILYPAWLNPTSQLWLAGVLGGLNLLLYGWIACRIRSNASGSK